VTQESGSPRMHGRVRIVRLPSGVGLLLAIPLFLVFGVASVAALLVAVSAVVVAPLFRSRGRAAPRDERDTIVLDRDAYRHLDDRRDLLESDRR
jgi:hypothetical protein